MQFTRTFIILARQIYARQITAQINSNLRGEKKKKRLLVVRARLKPERKQNIEEKTAVLCEVQLARKEEKREKNQTT